MYGVIVYRYGCLVCYSFENIDEAIEFAKNNRGILEQM